MLCQLYTVYGNSPHVTTIIYNNLSTGIHHIKTKACINQTCFPVFLQTLTCGADTLKDAPVVGVAGRGEMLFWAWA